MTEERRPLRRPFPDDHPAPRIPPARDGGRIRVTAQELAWIEANPERAARAVFSVDRAVAAARKARAA